MSKTTYIYVLICENGKYYIGKTTRLKERLREHIEGNGSAWTKIHKPIGLLEKIESTSNDDENIITRRYMWEYGIENVRGGSYVKVRLPRDVISVLTSEQRGDQDRCFGCGKKGHFIRDCRHSNRSNNFKTDKFKTTICSRCGRNGHTEDKCYSSYHLSGAELKSNDKTKNTSIVDNKANEVNDKLLEDMLINDSSSEESSATQELKYSIQRRLSNMKLKIQSVEDVSKDVSKDVSNEINENDDLEDNVYDNMEDNSIENDVEDENVSDKDLDKDNIVENNNSLLNNGTIIKQINRRRVISPTICYMTHINRPHRIVYNKRKDDDISENGSYNSGGNSSNDLNEDDSSSLSEDVHNNSNGDISETTVYVAKPTYFKCNMCGYVHDSARNSSNHQCRYKNNKECIIF